MKHKKVVLVIVLLGIGLFGYSQYASAAQIGVTVADSRVLSSNENGIKYDLKLEFDNPSLLTLTAGETEFVVTINDIKVGRGTLESFVLTPLSKTTVEGTFITDSITENQDTPVVRISGITKYDVMFTSIEVPFTYYPTEEQAREFIHQN